MINITAERFLGFPIEVVDSPKGLIVKHQCMVKDSLFTFPRFMPAGPDCPDSDLPPGFKKINDASAELVFCPFCKSPFTDGEKL